MIGKTVSHYKILEKLGEGGMGIVYKAEDTKLKRTVALKFLPFHITINDTDKERFLQEARAAAALNHPNVCVIHDIQEFENQQFIVMEYIEGKTLRQLLSDEGQLTIETAIEYAIQIGEALKEAHKKGIVHRDVKSDNIMVTTTNQVKVMDFGLAKLKGSLKLTKSSSTVGTLAYMAPEQIQGGEVDARSDIFSFGVVLYEMLTGQCPFKGDYEASLIYSILNDEPEPIQKLRPDISSELLHVINRVLEKDPENRYQNIDELKADLLKLKNESEVASEGKKITVKNKFKPFILPAAIFIFLLFITSGYFIFYQPDIFEIKKTGLPEWENSIAVLPFDDLSPEGDQEWFCDGMTEQIITNLSKIKRLKVIGRTSVMKFKNTNKTLPEIGQELNVSHLLEGSIRKHEDNIRVTAQLINTEDGSHLWADDFDRKLDDVFIVQDDVSEEIATILLATLSPQEKKSIITNRPSNTEAYEYYMKGRYFHNKFFSSGMKEDFLTSEKMFKQAIKLDSDYADSYASLADLYNTYYWKLPDTASDRSKYMELQEAYLDTAYQIDPNSAEVNYAKGCIHDSKNEYEKAFNSYKTAIKINPNSDTYYRGLGWFLAVKGLTNLAIQCYSRAININPVPSDYFLGRGTSYLALGDYAKAESDLKKAIELNPDYEEPKIAYWLVLIEMKRFEEAKENLRLLNANYTDQNFDFLQAMQYAIDGDRDRALNTLKSEDFWHHRSILYSLLGLKNEAINVLYERIEIYKKKQSTAYLFLKNLSLFENLRSDPRFQEILDIHKKIYEENLRKYGDIDL